MFGCRSQRHSSTGVRPCLRLQSGGGSERYILVVHYRSFARHDRASAATSVFFYNVDIVVDALQLAVVSYPPFTVMADWTEQSIWLAVIWSVNTHVA